MFVVGKRMLVDVLLLGAELDVAGDIAELHVVRHLADAVIDLPAKA